MPVIKKTPATKTFFAFDIGNGQTLFERAWRIMLMDGALCPLPDPDRNAMSRQIEQRRKQQIHVDEIKRLCHVPTE